MRTADQHLRHGRRAIFALAAIAIGTLSAVDLPAAPIGGRMTPQQTPGSVEARNRAAVEAAFDNWGKGTGSPYDLLAEEASWTIVGRSDASRTYPSKKAFIDDVIGPFGARMRQGLKPMIRQLTTDGDKVVIFFDASGVAKDGVAYTNTYAWFWEMHEGRVTRAYAFFDSIAFNELWRRVAP